MKKIFAFAVVAMLLLAIPAAAANYKLTGEFKGNYDYANAEGTGGFDLSLNFSFDEAGLVTAYAPLTLTSGVVVAKGWWAKFATEPLNIIVSDNTAKGYKWSGIEGTFGMLPAATSKVNYYSKVWGKLSDNLSYTAQAGVEVDNTPATNDDYVIAAQLKAKLPLDLTLTTDFGWLRDQITGTGYNMGLATALTGKLPVIGGTFKVAAGNFADLELITSPSMLFWTNDDLLAFAAYAGVQNIAVGPVTIDEISYKMGMNGIYDALLDADSFYTLDLQEAVTNFTAKFKPVTVTLKNGVWFETFNPLGGNNANLDVDVDLGALKLGLNVDSKLNWQAGLLHGEKAELRASYEAAFGKLAAKVGYNSNWDGVGFYEVDATKYGADKAYAELSYTAPFGLYLKAWGDYNQKGTDTANAGIYAKYANLFTNVPYVVNLDALAAGRFTYKWTEAPTHDFDPIGMIKLESQVNGQWSGGLLFITRRYTTATPGFEPIASVWATYKATDMVTVKGTVTYRLESPATHNVYAQLRGDVKVSANSTAYAYWGNSGLKAVGPTDKEASYPWGAYFALPGTMYWDSFGAGFSIKF